jgi:hypothetical protein
MDLLLVEKIVAKVWRKRVDPRSPFFHTDPGRLALQAADSMDWTIPREEWEALLWTIVDGDVANAVRDAKRHRRHVARVQGRMGHNDEGVTARPRAAGVDFAKWAAGVEDELIGAIDARAELVEVVQDAMLGHLTRATLEQLTETVASRMNEWDAPTWIRRHRRLQELAHEAVSEVSAGLVERPGAARRRVA